MPEPKAKNTQTILLQLHRPATGSHSAWVARKLVVFKPQNPFVAVLPTLTASDVFDRFLRTVLVRAMARHKAAILENPEYEVGLMFSRLGNPELSANTIARANRMPYLTSLSVPASLSPYALRRHFLDDQLLCAPSVPRFPDEVLAVMPHSVEVTDPSNARTGRPSRSRFPAVEVV